MTFDEKKFMKTKFRHREEAVPVPELADFFKGEGGAQVDPVWIVRGLGGIELGKAKLEADQSDTVIASIIAMTGNALTEKVEAFKTIFGKKGIPGGVSLGIQTLISASVSPVCDLELALKICKVSPSAFDRIVKKAQDLTAMGMQPGKPQVSGPILGSETA